ncbi:MAG: ankyrin repeat domain-containing protein, partial [Planctomycetota bacterium]
NLKEDFGGSTPLILASIYGNEQVVRLLINNGADLESRNKSDVTALHQACFFCRPKIVKTLLEAGAVSNFRNRKGKTQLEVISAEFSEELRAVYAHIYNVLNLEFNPENIEKTRRVVAQILRDHEKSQAEEQVK